MLTAERSIPVEAAFGISDAAAAARESARQSPFIWVTTSGTGPCVRGVASHVVTVNALGDPFLAWRWDGETLVVRNDPFGLIPAFVYRRGREIAVSTSLQKLLDEGARSNIDHAALAVFLRLGFFVGDDTPFEDIRALPPGATLVWNHAGCEIAGGVRIVPAVTCTRRQAMDRAIE